MCLTINFRKHKRPNRKADTPYTPLIAQRDILVYKSLDRTRKRGAIGVSPYQQAHYYSGKLETAKFSFASGPKDYYSYFTCLNEVHKGLHAHVKSHYKDFLAVIPKGAEYYIGTNNDVVSNKLIVFKDMNALKRYYKPLHRRRNCI